MSHPATVLSHGAESTLRHPGELLRRMFADLWAARPLAWEMLRRDIEAQYRQSLFGVFLAFLPPLVTMAWCTLIQHARVINVPELDVPYPAFVLLSMMLWTTFIESMNAPIQGLMSEIRTLARANFPPEAVLISRFGDMLFNFAIKLILIVIAVFWFQLPITGTVFLAPIAFLLLVFLGTAIGLFLAPINILYRDIASGLQVITTFWLFLTPVLFPVPQTGLASWIVRVNPVSPLLSTTREWATTGVLSEPMGFLVVGALTPLLLMAGWIFFRVSLPVVIDRTNA